MKVPGQSICDWCSIFILYAKYRSSKPLRPAKSIWDEEEDSSWDEVGDEVEDNSWDEVEDYPWD